jgi:predicted dehydrogenase
VRAVVVGAGYAAEGQIAAFRHLGLEAAAVCGRQAVVVEAFAERLGIAEASTAWEATLRRVFPDVVCLATPAALREPVVRVACELGCDVFCDKPLAATVAEAERMLAMVERAGVRHAYAATRRYDPSVQALARWVREAPFGRPLSVDVNLQSALVAPLPWSWVLDLAQGGGLLNNHFPHVMAILEAVLGGTVAQASGTAFFDIASAPVVPEIHDYREHVARVEAMSPAEIAALEHRPCDADTRYTADLVVATSWGEVPAAIRSGLGGASLWSWRFERGEVRASGELSFELVAVPEGGFPLSLPVNSPLDGTGHPLGDRYACLARAMLGLVDEPYPTFADGLWTQRAIAAIRGR